MSDPVSINAVGALEAALTSLLPAVVPNPLTRRLRVLPAAIRPLGLGAFVGRHVGPDAALVGRRVSARCELVVEGGTDDVAAGYLLSLHTQLVASSRQEFASRGIQRLSGAPVAARGLVYEVDFEFVPVPQASEGLIERIELDSVANLTPYARTATRAFFSAAALASLADFAPQDDADLDPGSPPGAWALAPAAGNLPPALVQNAATRGGPLDLADARKAGAMLLLRPGGAALSLERLWLRVDVHSTSPDGIGLVFRRRAADDHWFFLMSQRHGYHLFGRRTPQGWSAIATAAAGFAVGAPQRLVVAAYDDVLWAELDGRRTLTARTPLAAQPGEVALLTHGNAGARFAGARLMELMA